MLLAVFFPGPGIWLKNHHAIWLFILTIFFINGYNLRLKRSVFSKHLLTSIFTGALSTLVLFPLLLLNAVELFTELTVFSLGLLLMLAMPPTLTSGIVISENSGGDKLWALVLTITLNSLAVLTLPWVLAQIFSSQSGFTFPYFSFIIKMLLLVLLPLALGYFLRSVLGKSPAKFIAYVPSLCVQLSVYLVLSESSNLLFEMSAVDYLLLVSMVVVAKLLLSAWTLLSAYFLRLKHQQFLAYYFVVGQKTLPLALSALLFIVEDAGMLVLALIFFHFFQLITDSATAIIIKGK